MIGIILTILMIWSLVALVRFLLAKKNYPVCVKQDNGDYFYYLREWLYSRRLKYIRLARVSHSASPMVKNGSYVKRGCKVVCISGNVHPSGRPKIISFFVKTQQSGIIHYRLDRQGINEVLFTITPVKQADTYVEKPKPADEKTDCSSLWPESVQSSGNELRLSASYFDSDDRVKLDPSNESFFILKDRSLAREFHYVEANSPIGNIARKIGYGAASKFSTQILAHKSGYLGKFTPDFKVNQMICRIYDTPAELVANEILSEDNLFDSSLDDFSHSLVITLRTPIRIKALQFKVSYREGCASFIFEYSTESSIIISKDDTITFLFDNGEIITISVESAPVRKASDSKARLCEAIVDKDTLTYFVGHYLEKIKISGTAHEDIVIENESIYPLEVSRVLVKEIMTRFSEELAFHRIELEDMKSIQAKTGETTCFVYIMKDEKNGCHKIGISNRPEYREKTLQSDKPFIIMLKAKEFPTRKIARAFEQALHKTYQERHVRGEWFELTPEEVKEVMDALD